MGHIRLGPVPKSQPWQTVVETVVGRETPRVPFGRTTGAAGGGRGTAEAVPISRVAARTLDAAEAGLNKATNDPGLVRTFYLLTQVALASRDTNWRKPLAGVGIEVSEDSNVFQLTAAFQGAVDEWVMARGVSSDISEMAQKAAGEALCSLAADKANTLFGEGGEELRQAIRHLSTKDGFASLGQAFFGRFLTHYLNFYLSRITASELGSGPLQSLGSISRFNESLARHCDQSAAIIRNFAGEWYSKTEYEKGIDARLAGGFVAVAIKKIQAELREQRKEQ